MTTVTPVAKQPSASRNVRGSDPVRYSRRGSSSAMGDAAIQGSTAHSIASSSSSAEAQHIGDGPVERLRHEVARLEGVVLVLRPNRPFDGEGQALDLLALQAEMRFAEAGGEPRAEDLQFPFSRARPNSTVCQ